MATCSKVLHFEKECDATQYDENNNLIQQEANPTQYDDNNNLMQQQPNPTQYDLALDQEYHRCFIFDDLQSPIFVIGASGKELVLAQVSQTHIIQYTRRI